MLAEASMNALTRESACEEGRTDAVARSPREEDDRDGAVLCEAVEGRESVSIREASRDERGERHETHASFDRRCSSSDGGVRQGRGGSWSEDPM
jgi:hypothetical protein